jgi:hypothetical protein
MWRNVGEAVREESKGMTPRTTNVGDAMGEALKRITLGSGHERIEKGFWNILSVIHGWMAYGSFDTSVTKHRSGGQKAFWEIHFVASGWLVRV